VVVPCFVCSVSAVHTRGRQVCYLRLKSKSVSDTERVKTESKSGGRFIQRIAVTLLVLAFALMRDLAWAGEESLHQDVLTTWTTD